MLELGYVMVGLNIQGFLPNKMIVIPCWMKRTVQNQNSNAELRGVSWAPVPPMCILPSAGVPTSVTPAGSASTTGGGWTEGQSWGNNSMIWLFINLSLKNNHSILSWEAMGLSSCPQKLEIAGFLVARWTWSLSPAFLFQSLTPWQCPVFVVLIAAETLHIEADRGKISWASLILAWAHFQLGDFAASFNVAISVCVYKLKIAL